MTNIVIITGCEEQEINLHKHYISLTSILLTKYNLRISDTSLRKRQVKNYKHINYALTQRPEETAANCWSNRKVELIDTSYHHKGYMRQDFLYSLLLPNSITKLHDSHMGTKTIPDNIFHVNLLSNQYEQFEMIHENNFYTFISKDMLGMYTDWTFNNMPNKQKESYYPSRNECNELKHEDWAASLFVLHKFVRRNLTIEEEIEPLNDDIPTLQPTCNKGNSEMSRVTEMMQFSQSLQHKAELDVTDWLIMISGTQTDTLQGLGAKIAFALQKHYASWTLAIAASFYWRVSGDSRKALDCILQSLENVPKDMQDILLVILASLLGSQNYFHEALEVAQIAHSIGPDFVINHYVLANLHAALGDFEAAASFYKSSLEIDPNFEPAITRLRVILCFSLFDDQKSAMSEILMNVL